MLLERLLAAERSIAVVAFKDVAEFGFFFWCKFPPPMPHHQLRSVEPVVRRKSAREKEINSAVEGAFEKGQPI